jgi:tetratricopeptide (TPR) repeat protein
LAIQYHNLGICYRRAKKTAEAEAAYQQALDHEEVLVGKDAERVDYQLALAKTMNALGTLYLDNQKLSQAKKAYEKALNIRSHIVDQYPKENEYLSDLSLSFLASGLMYQILGDTGKAEDYYQSALTITKDLVKKQPVSLFYNESLAGSYLSLGRSANENGNHESALESYASAQPILEGVLKKEPNQFRAKDCLCKIHWRRAEALSKLARHDEAAREWDQALKLDNGRSGALIRCSRAAGIARSSNHARATAEADALSRNGSLDGDAFYDLITTYALAAAAIGNDAMLPRAERDQLADQYVTRGLELLSKAIAAGYLSPAKIIQLKKDKELERLRQREGFSKLLAQLQGSNGK